MRHPGPQTAIEELPRHLERVLGGFGVVAEVMAEI
jgi:hypothetical protein